MRILVTGGAGFIGSHVVDAAIAGGHEVAILDNLWPHGGGRRPNINPKAQFFDLDIRDPAVADVFTRFKPELLSHHAAQHSVPFSVREPAYDADVNVGGLINLLECCARAKTRKVVFASSAATYGTPQYLPIDESHPQRPESPYGITKMVSEHYLRFYAAQHGVQFTALRYGNVYGPRQDPHGEAGVVGIFCDRILAGQPIRIDWDGEQSKDYVFVGDVAHANLVVFEKADGEIVNIGTGVATTVNQLHRAVASAVGRDVTVEHAPRRPGDVRSCVYAIEKAKALGWTPQTPLPQGIAATIEFLRNVS